MDNPRGYEPAPTITPEEINVPLKNELVPNNVSNLNWTEGEVRGRGADPATPRP